MKFEEYELDTANALASRFQYPLKLAFALTVHRAQGKEFNRLEVHVDCFVFRAGTNGSRSWPG